MSENSKIGLVQDVVMKRWSLMEVSNQIGVNMFWYDSRWLNENLPKLRSFEVTSTSLFRPIIEIIEHGVEQVDLNIIALHGQWVRETHAPRPCYARLRFHEVVRFMIDYSWTVWHGWSSGRISLRRDSVTNKYVRRRAIWHPLSLAGLTSVSSRVEQ